MLKTDDSYLYTLYLDWCDKFCQPVFCFENKYTASPFLIFIVVLMTPSYVLGWICWMFPLWEINNPSRDGGVMMKPSEWLSYRNIVNTLPPFINFPYMYWFHSSQHSFSQNLSIKASSRAFIKFEFIHLVVDYCSFGD